MKVLVTGGLGYIGSHTALELLERKHQVVVVDNLYNAEIGVKDRLEQLSGQPLSFYQADCLDRPAMEEIFAAEKPDAVIHFAGYKAVGESVRIPLKYYENNLLSALVVLDVMLENGCKNFIFSSSATVYSPENHSPLREGMSLAATNPYGWTKVMIEQMLRDTFVANPDFTGVSLRYFNPIGAHDSGLLGEKPVGIPNNLMPYICQVADGTREKLYVFGNDYDTVDGTGVRDYIHVLDLAEGHVAALEKLADSNQVYEVNLGTGRGTSVLELVHAFEKANALTIPYVITDRRPGDVATVYADTQKAKELLGWRAKRTMEEACASSWKFQQGLAEEQK